MKVWIVVAIWVWWTTMVGAGSERKPHKLKNEKPSVVEHCTQQYPPSHEAALVAERYPPSHEATLVAERYPPSYEKVNFTTEGATKNSYREFMKALRDKLLTQDRDERYGIPVLRHNSTVPDSQRFVLVELSNSAGVSITLAIDVSNLYVAAYRVGTQSSYFFRDNSEVAYSNLFTDTHRYSLTFTGSYPDLERVAERSREDILLGIYALKDAIFRLYTSGSPSVQARALIILIEMVSEAARFRPIERRVLWSIIRSDEYQSFPADVDMLSLENSWEALSSEIQQSNQGVFSRPVQLQSSGHTIQVDSVTQGIISTLAIMLFICRDRASQFSLPIRSVVAVDDDTCVDPEPTVRIRGRNGLCVDVKNGDYHNGNPIILWTCNEPLTVNQLWTLKTDGTIRSNGKCLTTSENGLGLYVMIYDCPNPVTDRILWEVWDNGTIINPQSKLVLSAESGNLGTTLTVETNIYASRQGWLAGNNSKPFVTSIIGHMDHCMQASGEAMWLEKCECSKPEQKWALYADGSIRPDQNRDSCLTNNNQDNIIISSCSPGSEGQRWVFRNDGTILNLNKGMVMDVKQSNPSLHQIILYPFTGNTTQKWLPMI